MPTRQKRPSLFRQALVATALLSFQGYLAYSAINGQFGFESERRMGVEIEVLKARSAALQADIDAYKHRIALFDPRRLDPDILTEKARALLGFAHKDDIIILSVSGAES